MRVWLLGSGSGKKERAVSAVPKSICIDTRLPNAHPMKKELLEKLRKWGKVTQAGGGRGPREFAQRKV